MAMFPVEADGPRTVLYIRPVSFYVACHRLGEASTRGDDPQAVVLGRGPGALIVAASDAAQDAGVRVPGPALAGLRACPPLRCWQADFGRYERLSLRIQGILRGLCAAVEPHGAHAWWCDASDQGRGMGVALYAAHRVHRTLRAEVGIACTVGCGANRALATLASRLCPRGGVGELRRADVPVQAWPLPVEALPLMTPALAARCRHQGMRTIGDIAQLGPGPCERLAGQSGWRLWTSAYGRDDRPVQAQPSTLPVSLAQTMVWPSTRAPGILSTAVWEVLAQRVATALHLHGWVAGSLRGTVDNGAGSVQSRTGALPFPTDEAPALVACTQRLAAPRSTQPSLSVAGPGRRLTWTLAAVRLEQRDHAPRPATLFSEPPVGLLCEEGPPRWRMPAGVPAP